MVEGLGSKFCLLFWTKSREERRREENAFVLRGEVEKIDELFSNHALESDDKEESECASPMIINYLHAIIPPPLPPPTANPSRSKSCHAFAFSSLSLFIFIFYIYLKRGLI